MSSPKETTPEAAAVVPEASSSTAAPAAPVVTTESAASTVPTPATTIAAGPVVALGSANLEAEADDADSSLGDEENFGSSTTSMSSRILNHRLENGRTYHAYKDGKYMYPNDETENDRLDLQAHIYSIFLDGKLHMCEFDKNKQVQNVLDVGTGTGIWAIDFGDKHPEAKVLGIDLSPIQPHFVPPNVMFQIDDVEETWTYSHKFDFIYSRFLTGSLKNWTRYFVQAFENLTPGGYIEAADGYFPISCDDGTIKPDSALQKWSDLFLEATIKIGRPLNSALSYKRQMEEAGFVDVVETVDRWPLNRWPKNKKYKEIGMWNTENFSVGVSGFSMALFTRVHGWSMEEVEAFLVDVRKEIKNTSIHSYMPVWTVYGRKPS